MWKPFFKFLLQVAALAKEVTLLRPVEWEGPEGYQTRSTDVGVQIRAINPLRPPQQVVAEPGLKLDSSDSKVCAFPPRRCCFESKSKIKEKIYIRQDLAAVKSLLSIGP